MVAKKKATSRQRRGNAGTVAAATGSYAMMPTHQVLQAYDLCFASFAQQLHRFQIAVRNVSVQSLYDNDWEPDSLDEFRLNMGAMEFIFHYGALAQVGEEDLGHKLIQSNAPRILLPLQFGRDLWKSLTGAAWDMGRMQRHSELAVV